MKHKCLALITLLFGSFSYAQTCPEISFVVSLPTEEVVFIYDNPGPDCNDRPAAIVIDGSAYSLGNCDSYSSRYVLSSGSGVIDHDNYTVTYGGLTCTYNNGTLLGVDDPSKVLERTIKLFPNPVSDKELQIQFTIPLDGNVTVYNLLGQPIITDELKFDSEMKMNAANLENGLYLLQIDTGVVAVTKKFIVNR